MIAEEEMAEKVVQDEEPEITWNLQAIHAEQLQDEVDVQQRVRVAVLDSGVDYSTGINLAGSVDLVDREASECMMGMFQDGTGHGTAIASIISGNGETGVLGVNPNAELYSVKVLDDSNTAPLSRIIEGIYWCIDNDINIINMSFGTSKYSPALQKAVADAYDANILLVAAAGNHASAVEYPAAFAQVMAVASTDTEAQLSTFSNTGEELDVAAPRERIRVAHFLDGYTITHGTSIAVPHVVGAASLLWEKDTSKSNEFIRQLLDFSAKEIADADNCGLLDVNQAIAIYDSFAKNFDGMAVIREDKIPENTAEPETFAYIADDENYVGGRWWTDAHGDMVEDVAKKRTMDLKLIKILMLGIKYPDRSNWKGGTAHPWWHGYGKEEPMCNYIGCYELATNIALKGGKPFTFKAYQTLYNTTSTSVKGIDQDIFNRMMVDIDTVTVGGKEWAEVLKENGTKIGGNSKENRKYFLWGCAMHILTDSFSHETRRLVGSKMVTLTHAEGADNPVKVGKRAEVAMKAIHYSLNRLEADNGAGLEKGIAGNCSDYYYALKHAKFEGEFTKFKLLGYAKQNQNLTQEKIELFEKASWN